MPATSKRPTKRANHAVVLTTRFLCCRPYIRDEGAGSGVTKPPYCEATLWALLRGRRSSKAFGDTLPHPPLRSCRPDRRLGAICLR